MTTVLRLLCASIVGLSVWVASATEGGTDSGAVAVYEDWGTHTIRPDRWLVRDGVAHDLATLVRGHKLLMRYRHEGATPSNTGFAGAVHNLALANPAGIDRLEADFKVRRADVVGCAANPGWTRLRPASISFNAFNDGSSSVGLVGDHIVRILVNREADATEPPGTLTAQAFMGRCIDPTCSNSISTVFNLAVGTVTVGKRFTLRIRWDRPLARFIVGVDDAPEAVLAYDPRLDAGNAHVPFADVRMQTVVANCAAAPTSAEAETEVHQVRTTPSAVIP